MNGSARSAALPVELREKCLPTSAAGETLSEILSENPICFLQAPHFGNDVRHGFSTRRGGVSPSPFDTLNLGPAVADKRENIYANFDRFCAAVGVRRSQLVLTKQVHEDTVRVVTRDDCGDGLERPAVPCDALIACDPAVALMVFFADCTPVLLYDPDTQAVGALHAGWRGTALGIARKTVNVMRETFSTNPARLRAAIGPCIHPCCFKTRRDVPDALFQALGEAARPYIVPVEPDPGVLAPSEPRFCVDLPGVNALWLTQAGVLPENIAQTPFCTMCREDLFFSHRRSGPKRGLMAAVIQAGGL